MILDFETIYSQRRLRGRMVIGVACVGPQLFQGVEHGRADQYPIASAPRRLHQEYDRARERSPEPPLAVILRSSRSGTLNVVHAADRIYLLCYAADLGCAAQVTDCDAGGLRCEVSKRRGALGRSRMKCDLIAVMRSDRAAARPSPSVLPVIKMRAIDPPTQPKRRGRAVRW
jgi:hypothetical protein